jgi:hypothetical protein
MSRYNFPPYISENLHFLNKLAKSKSDKRRHTLLLRATPDQILSIVEISYNILKSNFVLTNRQKQRLAQFAEYYRHLARSKTEKTARHRIQEGGQLAITALLAPVLSELAQTLLDKALHKK